MVNPKRVEQKLPLLVTDDPWYKSCEIDRNTYRLSQFKRRCPERYNLRKNNILSELEALKREMDDSMRSKRLR